MGINNVPLRRQSQLTKFHLDFEYDMTVKEVRRITKRRTIKDGTGK